MKFATPLIPATLIRRYNRFLFDARIEDGTEIKGHCPNPGSMMGLKEEGLRIWIERNDDPKKKLRYGWRLVELESGAFVGVDTGVANKLVAEALSARKIKEVSAYSKIKPEQKYGEKSRIDFLLTGEGLPNCYLEVKSVTLSRQNGLAEFPDSVTARGAKHLGELAKVARQGHRAVLLYVVQRTDCQRVAVARDIDPTYAKALEDARAQGVEVIAYSAAISAAELVLEAATPV